MRNGKDIAQTGGPASAISSRLVRVAQFLDAASARPSAMDDARLQWLLGSQTQWNLLERLTGYDRLHHLRVHDLLVERGYRDPDLLRAALLHDAGKADSRGRVMLGHRVMRVVGNAVAPPMLKRVACPDGSLLTHGLYLAEHHARIGAELARQAGAAPRCCDLIARHEDHDTASDQDLAALIAADAEALR